MGILKPKHFHTELEPRMLEELKQWADDEADQLSATADHLNALLTPEHEHLVEAVAAAADRLRYFVEEL